MSKRELAGRGLLWSVVLLSLPGLAVFIVPHLRRAEGGTFTTPFWTDISPSPACVCEGCGCERPSELSPEGVSRRTGAAFVHVPLFSAPGMLSSTLDGSGAVVVERIPVGVAHMATVRVEHPVIGSIEEEFAVPADTASETTLRATGRGMVIARLRSSDGNSKVVANGWVRWGTSGEVREPGTFVST